jgi:NADH:ubiquinone oxidoreductase subunit 5 (subunit L)/multisubunit Na+/H+ antiporter MnhA subunit
LRKLIVIGFNIEFNNNLVNLFFVFFIFYVLLIIFFFLIKKFINIQYIAYLLIFSLGTICYINTLLINDFFFNSITLNFLTINFSKLNSILDFSFNFSLNILSFSFSFLVVLIGFTTNIYILNYFRGEADEGKFIFWINSFICSMLILVYANNFYTLFLGWELIGLTSFFLINFWNNRRGTLKSSFKAFSFNLVSDIFLLISFVFFFHSTGTTDCDQLYFILMWEGLYDYSYFNIGIIFLTLCASIKSVQIIGHLWLPDSMEAPVPASALIHSATLVSAGIYLICKFNYIYVLIDFSSLLITIGALTAAYGGVVSASQTDMKKLLAYSTMSHCGFLWVLACTGNFYITVLYLFLHGIFKAATFYCAGSFIRFFNSQDTRLMGSGSVFIPLDSFFLIICSANLAGLPFTIGIIYKIFFFKLLVLGVFNFLSVGFIFIGMLSSLVYFFRLTYYSVFDFLKIIKNIPLKYITFNKNQTNEDIHFTNYNHNWAVFILLFYSLGVYIYFKYLLTYNITQTSLNVENFQYTFITLTNLNHIYESYYIYFYFLYLVIFFLLILVKWRKNIFFFEIFVILLVLSIIIFFIFKMWGQIMTEANTLTNFNFGFSTYKSDILIHLSQWQYWWWFWFSFFWTVYFFIIVKIINKRTVQFNPIINTSIRGHGKWGDFLVALLPLSWCGNILVNSNFILRMIEWQNESSLFTLRVQGKQWYWVYKFDATASQNILAAPKNIGNNRWFITTPNESYCADSYYQAIHLSAQLEYKNRYLKLLKEDKITKNSIEPLNNKGVNLSYQNIDINLNNLKTTSYHDLPILDDTSNFAANIVESVKKKPLNILKGVLNKHNLENLLNNSKELATKNIFFVAKFNNLNGSIQSKPTDGAEVLWGFKQKKYKRLLKYKFSHKRIFNPVTFEEISFEPKLSALTLKSTLLQPITINNLKSSSIEGLENTDTFNYHRAVKYNRHRSELVPVTLARRLLRTKRTLVLPAHVNITLITNSYDVVHSWFIPGLGLKLDCVPGRSTHHTFYIDNIGFYYGQCAEICGRYHHHMPIRLCALPFEQFLVWWQKKGLKRMHRLNLLNPKKSILPDPNNMKFRYKW